MDAEWLEADGLGGFASGTVGGLRTRRYHALLLTATEPPVGRVVLVNGMELTVETDGGTIALNAQYYTPDTQFPDVTWTVSAFSRTPWPRWQFNGPGGVIVEQEIFVARESADTVLRWRRVGGSGTCRLSMRLLVSGRDYHALHRANPDFNFTCTIRSGNVSWKPYPNLPTISALTNGAYQHVPIWYYNFLYLEERSRGLECIEDLASPGVFTWDLAVTDAVLILRTGDTLTVRAVPYAMQIAEAEANRRLVHSCPLSLAADTYIVDRGNGSTLLAGFPWFTDWGRDTFIALRGLTITRSKLSDAEAILTEWASLVSEGMLPNRLSEKGEAEYNSVDSSLWFIIAVYDFFLAAERISFCLRRSTSGLLKGAVLAILEGYARGTRFGIVMADDGLLSAGENGVQLTWMDAKIGELVVTPRIGKPVEVQALWINALRIGGAWSKQWLEVERLAVASFARFRDPTTGGLYDVLDVGGIVGAVDTRIRPNQIFAVGGLPFQVIGGSAARAVVDLVERELLTPLGLRTLSPKDPEYQPFYRGGQTQRDVAYHQGSVWPWLMGPFVEAWLRTRDGTKAQKNQARERFIMPLLAHLEVTGLGHVSEIADGAPPHQPGGCPFQAWSLGELIRALALVETAEEMT